MKLKNTIALEENQRQLSSLQQSFLAMIKMSDDIANDREQIREIIQIMATSIANNYANNSRVDITAGDGGGGLNQTTNIKAN